MRKKPPPAVSVPRSTGPALLWSEPRLGASRRRSDCAHPYPPSPISQALIFESPMAPTRNAAPALASRENASKVVVSDDPAGDDVSVSDAEPWSTPGAIRTNPKRRDQG